MKKSQKESLQRYVDTLNDTVEKLAEMQQTEMEKYDNLSEGLQQAENGQAMESAADSLSDAVSEIELAVREIEGVIEA